MILVTLSHYPDLFAQLADGLAKHEPSVKPMLIRDGELIQNVPTNWEVVCAPQPFNYARNVNMAWEEAGEEDVLLCGDDVKINGSFVKTLWETAYNDPMVGIACVQLWGQSPFVCGYFKREIIDAVGLMDKRFDGYGREDTDWCVRMEHLGYHTQPVEIPVTHMGGGTSFYRRAAEGGESVQAASERANVLFEDKWEK